MSKLYNERYTKNQPSSRGITNDKMVETMNDSEVNDMGTENLVFVCRHCGARFYFGSGLLGQFGTHDEIEKNVTTEYSGSYLESLDKFLFSHGWNCQKFSTDHHYDDTARANFIMLNTDENLRIVEFGRVKCEINEVD